MIFIHLFDGCVDRVTFFFFFFTKNDFSSFAILPFFPYSVLLMFAEMLLERAMEENEYCSYAPTCFSYNVTCTVKKELLRNAESARQRDALRYLEQ